MLKIIKPIVPIAMQGTINRINTIDEANRDMTARESVSAGKYFPVGNRCFKATVAIIAGEHLVPGQNCEEINITDILNTLNEKGE